MPSFRSGWQVVEGAMRRLPGWRSRQIAPHIDQMVLFSGDGDFRSLVRAMQRRGARVIVVSSTPTAAQELRRQADEFIEIVTLKDKIGRDPASRQSRSSSEERTAREQRHRQVPSSNRAGLMMAAGTDEWDEED